MIVLRYAGISHLPVYKTIRRKYGLRLHLHLKKDCEYNIHNSITI